MTGTLLSRSNFLHYHLQPYLREGNVFTGNLAGLTQEKVSVSPISFYRVTLIHCVNVKLDAIECNGPVPF